MDRGEDVVHASHLEQQALGLRIPLKDINILREGESDARVRVTILEAWIVQQGGVPTQSSLLGALRQNAHR